MVVGSCRLDMKRKTSVSDNAEKCPCGREGRVGCARLASTRVEGARVENTRTREHAPES